MATSAQIDALTSLYIGYFDRAPDPAGLQSWIDAIDAGVEIETIAGNFATSAEAKALYPYLETPGLVTPASFVGSIYLNLFNRPAESDGLNYWVELLTNGTISPEEMILEIIGGAQGSDLTILENKIEAGRYYAETAASTVGYEYDIADARTAIDGVTEDAATVDAAKAASDAIFAGVDVVTATLTTGSDTGADFTGGDANDVFNAPLAPAIDGLLGAQTLQGSDVLEGGAGVDELNAELNDTGITQNPTISGIEVYNLTAFSGLLGGDSNLDLDRSTGYEQLWNRNSRSDLTLDNVGETAIIGLDNVRDGSEYDVNYDTIAVAEQTVVSMMSGRPGDAVTLDIDGVDGVIGTLNLSVSDDNYLFLDSDAADSENLMISGSGILELAGDDQFENLQMLDTLGYDGDVILDISGSGTLESVMTADGDDALTVSAATFSADTPATTLDLGMGDNRLILEDTFDTASDGGTYTGGGVIDSDELSALDFTLAPVSNVQTLELDNVGLGGDASLDLDGVGGLETLALRDFENSGGDDLLIENAPADLTIEAISDVDPDDADLVMNGGLLTVEGVVNLTIDAADDAAVDGSLSGDALETLVMNAGDDLDLDLFGDQDGGLNSLVSIEANATDTSTSTGGDSDADVNLDASAGRNTGVSDIGTDTELDALKTVNVNAATNATLTMTGRAGVAAFAGTQATQSFAINVTGGAPFGLFNSQTRSAGDVVFNSSDIPGGIVSTDYSTTVGFGFGANSGFHDTGAASDIAADLDALAELEASNTGNTVNVTWADVGIVDDLDYFAAASGASEGSLDSVTPTGFTQGQEATAQVDGEGFEAVETVSVDAQDGDADVDLTDVYGQFTLNVTATDNADVDLFNTNATSASVAAGTDAGDTATITVGGDTVGNAQLVDLVVSGDEADVTMSGNLDSFTTLDLSAVATDVIADTSGAIFDLALGEFVEYRIGATSDGDDTTLDVDFTGNTDAREIYNFVGDDIAEVEINDFDISADATDPGDRLDLSEFASNAGELVFSIDANDDIVITDLNGGLGDFGGEIKIVGTFTAADASDLANFNIIYG